MRWATAARAPGRSQGASVPSVPARTTRRGLTSETAAAMQMPRNSADLVERVDHVGDRRCARTRPRARPARRSRCACPGCRPGARSPPGRRASRGSRGRRSGTARRRTDAPGCGRSRRRSHLSRGRSRRRRSRRRRCRCCRRSGARGGCRAARRSRARRARRGWRRCRPRWLNAGSPSASRRRLDDGHARSQPRFGAWISVPVSRLDRARNRDAGADRRQPEGVALGERRRRRAPRAPRRRASASSSRLSCPTAVAEADGAAQVAHADGEVVDVDLEPESGDATVVELEDLRGAPDAAAVGEARLRRRRRARSARRRGSRPSSC